MNTIYRIGFRYVRANNVASALAIARRAADNEPISTKVDWLSHHPIKCEAYANQHFGNAGYDRAVNDETLGLVERFAQKAVDAKRNANKRANENRAPVIYTF